MRIPRATTQRGPGIADLRIVPLALALVLGAAACGDGPAGPGGAGAFDVASTAEAVRSVTAEREEHRDFTATMALVSGRLESAASVPSAASLFVARGWQPSLDADAWAALAGDLGRTSDADGSRALLLPETLLGSTLIWNPETDRYEVDPERTGAPADGVRFVMYEVDPDTGRPAEPLNEVGFVDLVDESTSDSGLRLRVHAVDTTGPSPVDLADYVVEGSLVLAGETRLDLSASGFLSDGTDRLDFSLSQNLTLPSSSSTARGSLDYSLSLEDGATVTLTADGTFDLSGGTASSLTATLTLEDGGDVVETSVEVAADGALDGAVAFNGREVILIAGTRSNPEFTRPDGSEVTQEEREALRDLFRAVEELLAFGASIFGVAGP